MRDKRSIYTIAIFSLFTLLLTFPTVMQFGHAIPGDGFDGWQNYWNQWWIKEALLNQHSLFFFSNVIYPPDGASLLFQTLNYFNGLWSLPIQLLFGATAAYNAVVFFHFILSGFGVYLLAKYSLSQLGYGGQKVQSASIIAGFIFTFSPFHMAHLLGHMQVLSLTWNPFYVLWIFRTLNNWRQNPSQAIRKKDLALSGLFLSFVTMIDWYQTLYMLLFTALILAWTLWRVWRDGNATAKILLKPILGLAAMGIAFGVIFSPLIVPMASEASTADYMRPSFAQNVELSADLLAFFTPSSLHPWWGKAVTPLYQNFTASTSEQLIFIGFVPLILTIIGFWQSRKKRVPQFWALFSGTFFVLALGPFLHIAGNIIKIGTFPIPLPYLALYKIVPFIGISRSLSRFDLMVMMGVGVLSALALVRMKSKTQWLFGALILIEFIAIPYPMSAVDTPDFFKSIAAEKDNYTIAYLPMNWDRPVPLLYQTVHGKKLLTAYTSRDNPLDQSWRTPVLQEWRTLSDDIIKANLAAIAPTVFHNFGIKYIVLDYYQMPPGPERDNTEKWVSAALPNQLPIYHDDRLTVYQAPPMTTPQPYLQLGKGWGNIETTRGQIIRQMQTTATLKVINGNSTATLTLTTIAPYTLNKLSILTDGNPLSAVYAPNGETVTVQLPSDTSLLTIHHPQTVPLSQIILTQNP